MSLTIITGPMFSGKTTTLLHTLRRYQLAGKEVLYIRHPMDDRKKNTHNKLIRSVNFKSDNVSVEHADVVGFDEVQFYGKEIVPRVRALVESGTIVIVSGLDGDCDQKKFGHILDLIPICDKVKKLHAICNTCGAKARFSKRITPDCRDQVMIGGSDKYIAVCRICLNC